MKSWEKNFITKHLPFFIQSIQCNTTFLSELLSHKDGFSREDEENIVCLRGNTARARFMIDILLTRTNGYQILAQSLLKTKQTEALLMLLRGVETNACQRNCFEYCGINVDASLLASLKIKVGDGVTQLKTHAPGDLYSLVKPILDASTYESILKEEPVELTKNSSQNQIKYYIPRSILVNCKLKKTVFGEVLDDIFLFEGIEPHQLTQLALSTTKHGNPPNLTDTSSNQLNAQTVRFVLLEHSSHMDIIADQSRKNVHWVKLAEHEYFLVRSSGPNAISKIKFYLEPVGVPEEGFVKLYMQKQTGSHVILCDSPGMGKSVLLKQIARHLQMQETNGIVLMLHCSELAKIITHHTGNITCHEIFAYLSDLCGKAEFGQKFLHKVFTSKLLSLHVLADAFDELENTQQENCLNVLQLLLNKCSRMRVIMTTRHQGLPELETSFGTLGHNILPFQESDKISFFLQYWKSKHFIKSTTEIRQFAVRCIQSLEYNTSSAGRQITGIPLQCQMLAEVFAEDASTIITSHNYSSSFGFGLKGIVELYTNYVSKGFTGIMDKQVYLTFHIYKALVLLFPELNHDAVKNVEFCFCDEIIFKIGLIEKNSMGQEQFVHRTFAEFLVAKHFFDLITSDSNLHASYDVHSFVPLANAIFKCKNTNVSEDQSKFFLQKYPELKSYIPIWERKSQYYSFRYARTYKYREIKEVGFVARTIVFFLNQLLEQTKKKVSFSKSRFYFSDQEAFPRNVLCNWIFACLVDEFEELLKCILSLISEHSEVCDIAVFIGLDSLLGTDSSNSEVILYDMLEHSAGHSTVQYFKHFWQLCHINGTYDTARIAVIAAVELGNFNVFEYLFSLNKQGILDEQNILTICVQDDSGNAASGKLGILKLLLKEKPELVKQNSHLCEKSHFLLIKELIYNGADLFAKDTRKNSIAHTATQYCAPDEYHELVCILLNRKMHCLFERRNIDKLTPLNMAFRQNRLVKSETLELLVKQGRVRFNNRNSNGATEWFFVFHNAYSSSCWAKILKTLCDLGADINAYCLIDWCDIETPLSLAVRAENLSVIKLLLDAGADVNKLFQCSRGVFLPLDFVVKHVDSHKRAEIKGLLETHGAKQSSRLNRMIFSSKCYYT